MKIISFIILLIPLVSCAGNISTTKPGIKQDSIIEYADLPFITIGNQKWAAFNLNVSLFRNGDTIPEARTSEEWQKAGVNRKPAWCYYENDSTYGRKYGKMYNWYAVNDSRGLAPKGWHIPGKDEWNELIEYLGGFKVAGGKIKAKEGWNNNGNGTDEVGFSALPAGERHVDGEFSSMGLLTTWWTSTAEEYQYAWYYNLMQFNAVVKSEYFNKSGGCSVRCVMD